MKNINEFNAEERIDIALLENSVFFLSGDIEEENIEKCIKWIAYEDLKPSQDKILTLYVNSTGGDLYQAFALIDIMNSSSHKIRTIGIGSVMSAAFLIVASGTRGERYVAHNTSCMCHQFSSGTDGKYHDLKAEMKETELLNNKMVDILAVATKQPPSYVKKRLLPPTDVYMTAQEMVEHGAADYILK